MPQNLKFVQEIFTTLVTTWEIGGVGKIAKNEHHTG